MRFHVGPRNERLVARQHSARRQADRAPLLLGQSTWHGRARSVAHSHRITVTGKFRGRRPAVSAQRLDPRRHHRRVEPGGAAVRTAGPVGQRCGRRIGVLPHGIPQPVVQVVDCLPDSALIHINASQTVLRQPTTQVPVQIAQRVGTAHQIALQNHTQPDQRRDISPLNWSPTRVLLTDHPWTVPAGPPLPGWTHGRVCWDTALRAGVAGVPGRRLSRYGNPCRDARFGVALGQELMRWLGRSAARQR